MTVAQAIVYALPVLGFLVGCTAVHALRCAYRRALARRERAPAPVDPLRDYAAWKADRRRRDRAEWQAEWLRLAGAPDDAPQHVRAAALDDYWARLPRAPQPFRTAALDWAATDANGRPVHSGGLIAGPGDNRIEDTRLDGTPGPRYTEALRQIRPAYADPRAYSATVAARLKVIEEMLRRR